MWVSKLIGSLEHFNLENSLCIKDLILKYFTVYFSYHIYWAEVFPFTFFNVMYFMLLNLKKAWKKLNSMCVCVIMTCNFSHFNRTELWKLPHKIPEYFTVYSQLTKGIFYSDRYFQLTWRLITRPITASSLSGNLKRSFTGSEQYFILQ